MPFKFRHLCDLLQLLDDNRIKKKVTGQQARNLDTPIILSWFNEHERHIPRHGTGAVAFLSCLFPERRADRVYNVQEKRLEKIVGRSLGLGTTRLIHLSSWRTANGADFAQTVQNVMSEAEFDRPRPEHELTLEEIDALFDRIAANYGGSSPELQARILDPMAADEALQPLFPLLQSNEAKWLIRMFLKRYMPIELPERLIMRQFHCLLPDVLRLQNCFTGAIRCLDDPAISHISPRQMNAEHEQAVKLGAASHLKPQVGIMVQRSAYDKARSIQHCCDMAARRRISVERKYDGEYCQVHIDISKGKKCIRIFSKSGKDSTTDRVRLHAAVENSLKLWKEDCPIKKQCILEGELLIWHEKKQQIQPFEKIRKHVTRNGRFLGNDQDSPRDLQEKVMIMFYDLLLYDDIVCLNESLEHRRSRLRSLVCRVPGQAELGYREKINFASSDAKLLIRRAFAKCISRGWEGFVLKGCDDPYFSLTGSPRCIKLKKDYITGSGDMADLAVIGGRRIARDEQVLNSGKLSWTAFHLGCLENGEEVRRFSAKPRFRIVGVVSAAKKTLSPDRTRLFNELGQFERIPYASVRAEMEVVMDQQFDPPTELFKNPFVVEVVGGGFEKPANVTYHSLRFPRVTKIHEDRPWHDIMTFDELQELADKAQAMAADEDSQEDRDWIENLIRTDPRSKFVSENSFSTTTGRGISSVATDSLTPSTRRSSISPLLVRIDTQELTEHERHGRALFGGNGHSSVLSPATVKPLLKRKRNIHEDSRSANMSIKRLRSLPQQTDPHVKIISGDQAHDLRSCGPQPRRPLLEVQNVSLASSMQSSGLQSSDTLPSNPRQQKKPNNPTSSLAKSTPATENLNRGKISADLTSRLQLGKALEEAPLPTPPTSSAKEDDNGKSLTVPRGQFRDGHPGPTKEITDSRCPRSTAPAALSSDEERGQSARSTSILQDYSPVIFLSPADTTNLPNDKHGLIRSLANVKGSFTFSRDDFLHNIQRGIKTSHLAIVNVTNPADTGNELAAFHRLISQQLRDGRLIREGRLVFFDWKVLPLVGSNEPSITGLRPHFSGCLAWRSGVVDAVRRREWEVKALWEWDEVMDPSD